MQLGVYETLKPYDLIDGSLDWLRCKFMKTNYVHACFDVAPPAVSLSAPCLFDRSRTSTSAISENFDEWRRRCGKGTDLSQYFKQA